MHVVLLVGWDVVIDDQLNAVDVNATRHDIGCDKDGQLLLAEREHHFLALRLFQIAGHFPAGDASLAQGTHHLAHSPFPRGEYNSAFDVAIFQYVHQYRVLLVVKQHVRPLLHLRRRLAQSELNCHRVAKEFVRQRPHPIRHGGGEQQGLAFFPTVRSDAHDVLVEPHVQHPIRLIQDQHLQRREVHVPQGEVG